jgi:hypothetical protein
VSRRRLGQQVRTALEQKLGAVAAGAVDGDGAVPERALAEAERLERLSHLLDRTGRDYRGMLFGLATGVVLAIALGLYSLRIDETEVVLTAEASAVGFTLAAPQPIMRAIAVRGLGVAGVVGVELPDGSTVSAPPAGAASDDTLALTLRPEDGRRPGTLSLDPGDLPEGTRVGLRVGDRPGASVLTLELPGGGEIAAVGRGALAVRGPGGSRRLDLAAPRGIRFLLGARAADFVLEGPPDGRLALETEIRVSHLQLHRVPQAFRAGPSGADAARPLAPQVSTVLAGTLSFEDLPDRQVALRTGQHLLVGRIVDARLVNATFRPAGIDFELRGRVGGLATGREPVRRSLMPTWLEWLQAHHLVKVLWGGLGVWLLLLPFVAQWRSRRAR